MYLSSETSPGLLSIQVGTPRGSVRADGRKWRSAILKTAVDGPVRLSRENLAGDRQCNLEHHGGPDKAVCAFAFEHYPVWEAFLDRSLPTGAFGENFTLCGMAEDTV